MDTTIIRPAAPNENSELEELVIRSLSHWGHDPVALERGRGSISTVPGSVTRVVMVAERTSRVIGFFALDIDALNAEVQLFFVDRPEFGKGVGRLMWRHLVDCAQSMGVSTLALAAEPGAEGFYLRMGMRRDHEIDQDGRRLLWMVANLAADRYAGRAR